MGNTVSAVLHRLSPSMPRIASAPSPENAATGGGKVSPTRNASVYVLSAVMFVLLALSIGLNLYEKALGLLPPLVAAACVAVAAFLWAFFRGTHATHLLFLLNFTLMLVGMFLFLRQGAPDGSSLFWFIVFPPMVMVSLGLRLGTAVFFGFYLVLFALLFTPLDAFLAHDYSRAVRIRFMLAMFGAFFFSWWVEYLRSRTYDMLLTAMRALERDSLTDYLTGLANRRDFYNHLARVTAECRRKGEPYVLALMDLDHFKRINDVHGHQVGDNVLCHAAATVAKYIRETDRMFRWGGEEFAIIMPACGASQGIAVAERIRRGMEDTPYAGGDLPFPLAMTISIGLYCGAETDDPELPVRIADANLYAAKEAGRNRVVCAGSGEE